MFKSKREIQLRKTIDAPLRNTLAFLHDHECMITPGEYVYHRAPDPNDPAKIVVKEHLPILGPVKGSTTFTARLVPTDDGCRIDVEAGMGTKVCNRYFVKEVESADVSRVEISEVATVEVFAFPLLLVVQSLEADGLTGMTRPSPP